MIHHMPFQKNLCNLFGTKPSTKLRQLGEEGGLGRRTMSGSFSNGLAKLIAKSSALNMSCFSKGTTNGCAESKFQALFGDWPATLPAWIS